MGCPLLVKSMSCKLTDLNMGHTEGSGLGLSIAQSLAESMGGEFLLSVDGDLFKAAVVFPTLPMPAAPEPQPPVPEEPTL